MPQLDGLRALAVLAVWAAHWDAGLGPAFNAVPWGRLGVWLFFVLSGFLITGILLGYADEVERGALPREAIKVFYIRRALRILPAYYVLLLATVLVNQQIRYAFFWHLTYTSNILFSLPGQRDVLGAHFWTLSVEEQFYVFWPLLVLLLFRRHLLRVAAALVVVGLAFRTCLCCAGCTGPAMGLLLFGSLDHFGLGAIIAYLAHRRLAQARNRFQWLGMVLGLSATVGLLAAGDRLPIQAGLVLLPTATAFAFAGIVGRAAAGFGGLGRWCLEARPVTFLGRISYGLYLYHPFVSWAAIVLVRRAKMPFPAAPALQFLIFGAVTVLVAVLSWTLIEQPANRLRTRFQVTAPAERSC